MTIVLINLKMIEKINNRLLYASTQGCAFCVSMSIWQFLYDEDKKEIYCNNQCLKGAKGLCMVDGCEKKASHQLILESNRHLTMRNFFIGVKRKYAYILNFQLCKHHTGEVREIEGITCAIYNALNCVDEEKIRFVRVRQ